MIQDTFESRPKDADAQSYVSTDGTSTSVSDWNDSVVTLVSSIDNEPRTPSGKHVDTHDEYRDFLKEMPRPTTDLRHGNERRLYSTKQVHLKEQKVQASDADEEARRKGSSFGLKFLGRISHHSVIQFEKLAIPQVLIDWPQWHREQRSKATGDGGVLQAILDAGLYTAVRLGNVEYVEELFRNGARDPANFEHGWTLLHHAITFSDEGMVVRLLRSGINPDMVVEKYGSALSYSAMSADDKMIDLLLRHNANPNPVDANNRPPLCTALRYMLGVDHGNKKKDPQWLNGQSEITRTAISNELRPGVRSVLLLLEHGAVTSSKSDQHQWRHTIQSKISKTQTHSLPKLTEFLAHPEAPGICELTVEFHHWIHATLKDSMKEAARGSVPSARPKTANKKSVRFEDVKVPRPAKKSQAAKKSKDTQRMEQVLGLR